MKCNRWKQSYTPIGLDIGSTAVRAIQLVRTGGRYQLHAALNIEGTGVPALPPSTAPASASGRDASASPPLWSSRLKDEWPQAEFVGKHVMLHCPADKMDLRPLHLPVGSEHLPRPAVLEALRLQMADHVPFSIDEAIIDCHPLPGPAPQEGLHLMVTTADGSWIRRRIRELLALGLQCVAMIPLPEALSRFPQTAPGGEVHPTSPDSDRRVLWPVLDIGHEGSTLIVHHQNQAIFCRRFDLGGAKMAHMLAQHLMMDISQAEIIKIAYGLDGQWTSLWPAPSNAIPATAAQAIATAVTEAAAPTSRCPKIGKLVYATLEPLFMEYVEGLIRSLNYVIYEHPEAHLETIQLCGRAANLSGLNHFLQERFEWPVAYVNHPILEQLVSQWPSPHAPSGGWSTALGLVLAAEEPPL